MLPLLLALALVTAHAEPAEDPSVEPRVEAGDVPVPVEPTPDATSEPAEAPPDAPPEPAEPTPDVTSEPAEPPPDAPPDATARPDPPVEPPPDPSPGPGDPFAEVLEYAKGRYFEGGHQEALELLLGLEERLAGGEEVGDDLQGEALIYLGEIQYVMGDTLDSWDTFEFLLQRNPDQIISIYHHPPEVVNWFGLVRREMLQSMADTPDDPPPRVIDPGPAPWWTWAPLGTPQFAQRRPVAGAAFAGIQSGLGVASIALYRDLQKRARDDDGDLRDMDTDEFRRFQSRRAIQWAVTAGWWGAWLASSADARRFHRNSLVEGGSVTVGTTEGGGAMLLVSGRL